MAFLEKRLRPRRVYSRENTVKSGSKKGLSGWGHMGKGGNARGDVRERLWYGVLVQVGCKTEDTEAVAV
jgi:hypothetical protein